MNQNDPLAERWQRLAEQWEDNESLPLGLRALVAEIAALQAAPALPPPDLSFLPPLSLAAYVRQVGERLSRLHFPEASGGLQSALDTFFRRLDPHRPRLLLETPPVYLTSTPDPMMVLTTTYITTVRLLDLNDPRLAQDSARLTMLAYEVAVAEAERQGLGAADADRLAAGFAEILQSTATLFGRLEMPEG
jgi:hypothetical protein